MKNNPSRKLLLTSLGFAFVTLLSGISINLLTSNADLNKWLGDHKIGIKELIGGAIAISIGLLLLDYLKIKYSRHTDSITENIEPDNRRLLNSLKKRYQNRYESKLDGRFEITLEVSEHFDTLNPYSITERFNKNASEGRAIEVIRDAFEMNGRLLIVGDPGVGKTVLLLKLAVNLLDKIKDLGKEPFPVIFNLASWSPAYKNNFGAWLNEMLASGYGFSKTFAERLLQQQRIIFLLDGLDELARINDSGELARVKIASEKRAECLEALRDYLHDERRAVITSRIEEFNLMREITEQDAPVSAKVKILKLFKAQVLNELEKAKVDTIDGIKHHASANNLLKMLITERTSNLMEVLRTPFYFTTAMAVFDREPRNEKELPETIEEIQPKTIEEIKTYLIEEFVKRKLKDEENSNNFESEKTIKWLNWLAELMRRRNRISFELIDLQLSDLAKKWYFGLFFGLVNALWVGLSAGLIFGLMMGLSRHDLGVGLFAGWLGFLYFGGAFGLLSCLASALSFRFGTPVDSTEDIIDLDFSKILQLNYWVNILRSGLVAGLISVLGIGLLGLLEGDVDFGLFGLLVGGLFGGLSVGLFVGFNKLKKTESVTYIQNPYQRIYGSFSVNIAFTFLTIMLAASCLYVSIHYVNHIVLVTLSLLFLLLVVMFQLYKLFNEVLFTHTCLRFCLYLEGRMPLKYATFLDYAASLQILEKDGGSWRFRHQKLQDYFANLDRRKDWIK